MATVGLFAIPSAFAAPNATQAVNKATVTYTAGEATLPFCLDQVFFFAASSNTPVSTADSFTLNITLREDLCSAINAKAAIYDMPSDGSGNAWPQTLVSVTPVAIQKAGTYSIRFEKLCTPAQFDTIAQQFDVINGATPDTIYTSLDHGPLLFPFDIGTAQQYFGKSCETTVTTEEPTTSVLGTQVTRDPHCRVSTTSTSTTSSTTTTTQVIVDEEIVFEPEVLDPVLDVVPAAVDAVIADPSTTASTTTTSVPCDPTTTVVPVSVAGISATNTLPVTGSPSFMLASSAIVLMGSGALFVIATRRRKLINS